MENYLKSAIDASGGTAALARALGITPQAVSQWTKCPPERVLAVEAASGVDRHLLRPDIFGCGKHAAVVS